MFVLAKMACEAGLEITGFTGKKKSCSNKGLSDQECEFVKQFYLENEIFWQAPGRKDRAIITNFKEKRNSFLEFTFCCLNCTSVTMELPTYSKKRYVRNVSKKDGLYLF